VGVELGEDDFVNERVRLQLLRLGCEHIEAAVETLVVCFRQLLTGFLLELDLVLHVGHVQH